jgi:hypothetical protein
VPENVAFTLAYLFRPQNGSKCARALQMRRFISHLLSRTENGAVEAAAQETPASIGPGNKRQAAEGAGGSAKKARTDIEDHAGAC